MKWTEFGDEVRLLRIMRKVSQQKLADAVGISRKTIVFYERGKHTPSLEVAHKIARALRVEFSFELKELKNPSWRR